MCLMLVVAMAANAQQAQITDRLNQSGQVNVDAPKELVKRNNANLNNKQQNNSKDKNVKDKKKTDPKNEEVKLNELDDDGNVVGCIQTGNALSDTLTDIVEVRGLTTDDTPQDNDGIITIVEGHLTGTVDELKRTGNSLDMDILRKSTMLL